jgi:RND family efflux transporter MFP subunit
MTKRYRFVIGFATILQHLIQKMFLAHSPTRETMPAALTRLVAPLLVIAASIGIYNLLHATKPEPEKSEGGPRPISVYTAPVTQSDITLRVHASGEVRARTEIDLATQVGGRIIAVSDEFTEGGQVRPGTALLQVEDTDYRLALRQAEARVAEAHVRVEQALADADVARKQLRNEAQPSKLALKIPQVAEAKAGLEAAKANLEQARQNLERTAISLPFSGRLTATHVDIGQYITPGTVVASAFGTDVVEVRLPLADAQLASLALPIGFTAAPGEGLPVTLSAKVAGLEQQWQGRLVRLDAAIDPDTRMLYGIVEVIEPYGANVSASGMPLAVGLFVAADISGRQLQGAHTIPRDALRAGNIVFLVDQQSKLQIREVKVIHSSPDRAVIGSGLQAGERIVTSPVRNPVQGMALLAIDRDSQLARESAK